MQNIFIFAGAIDLLSNIFAKTPSSPSPIFDRYALISCRQHIRESLDTYFQKLKRLSIDFNFQAVSAQVYKEEAIREHLLKV